MLRGITAGRTTADLSSSIYTCAALRAMICCAGVASRFTNKTAALTIRRCLSRLTDVPRQRFDRSSHLITASTPRWLTGYASHRQMMEVDSGHPTVALFPSSNDGNGDQHPFPAADPLSGLFE